MTIYFDNNKKAYGYAIESPLATTTDELWKQVCFDNDAWDIVDGVFVDKRDTAEYKAKQTTKRQTAFNNKFLTLATNKNYRLQPKGYANAQQSIDTVNAMVNTVGSLTQEIATMVLFYQTPDFSKEEECTEEWLVQHQYSASAMTKEEWATFYVDFTTKYAQKMYQQALLGAN